MPTFEIPLNPYPESFSVTINNVAYGGKTSWNNVLQTWTLGLYDQNQVPVLLNLPLIPGVNLLGQFDYLNIGARLGSLADHDPNAVPSFSGLGSTGHVYVVTP